MMQPAGAGAECTAYGAQRMVHAACCSKSQDLELLKAFYYAQDLPMEVRATDKNPLS